ncbi:MAG: hypothetical protein LEGION0403_FIIPPAGN_00707 [Legionella sp.]|uniref:hypothetical protein n=1 Tax=Legionella sp. TaxID=459 RepID=UPI003D0CD08C
MPPKKEKQVSFDPRTETHKFVKNVHNKVKTMLTEDTTRTEAAAQINEAFTTYLGQLKQNFPMIVVVDNRAREVDPRITVYYVLMDCLAKNDAKLPSSYKQTDLAFHVSGWPVASDDESFVQWGVFTRAAVAAFQKAFPDANLTAWAVPHSNAQVGSQPVPEELENYDFDAWQAPVELTALRASINAMHAYGLRLKSACPQKAHAAMQLAIELTQDLQNYYEALPEEQNKEAFVTAFHTKLHSQDDLMSTHRHYSKVVLVNIAIALTGVGLAAIVVSLLIRGHGFYSSTQGQNTVNDIDQQFDKSLKVT